MGEPQVRVAARRNYSTGSVSSASSRHCLKALDMHHLLSSSLLPRDR